MRVVLGVGGGIAAYKACTLLRLLVEDGHEVTVVPTAAALRFVGEPTWAALSGRPVATDVWTQVHHVPHVRLGQQADLVVVAPATADLVARAAHGMADDLLTNTLLTARCPVVMAPAMHTEMWLHPATQENVATLRARGVHVMEPASGRLTGPDTGPGRLPEASDIHALLQDLVAGGAERAPATEAGAARHSRPGPLQGRRVVVSAGGTREALDPVRFLGNRSSGKQGYALAAEAARRGAEVTLVAANCDLADPEGVRVVPVESALDLQEAVVQAGDGADVIVMAAAVADFRPKHYSGSKIKKTHRDAGDDGDGGDTDGGDTDHDGAPTIELVRNPDILAGLVRRRGRSRTPVIVGFAAETGDAGADVLAHARAKLQRKGCDLLVANEVGQNLTFGQDRSTVHILRPGTDEVTTTGPAPKSTVAAAVWDAIAELG